MSSNAEHARADRPSPTNPARDDDAWTDDVADRVQALLREEGLELELVVFYDSLTEVLHAVGYDGAPARFFANYLAPPDSPRSRGTLPDASSGAAPSLRAAPAPGPSAKSHNETSQAEEGDLPIQHP